MSAGTAEERIDEMIVEKRKLADVLAGDAEVNLTELSDEALMDLVRLDVTRAAPQRRGAGAAGAGSRGRPHGRCFGTHERAPERAT